MSCDDDGPDDDDSDGDGPDDDDHLDPPHLHLGHAAFCLKGVEVGGQGEHHVALSHTNLTISMVIVLIIMFMIMIMMSITLLSNVLNVLIIMVVAIVVLITRNTSNHDNDQEHGFETDHDDNLQSLDSNDYYENSDDDNI